MAPEMDFSRGKRYPVVKAPTGKTRITIRLDSDLLFWFHKQARRTPGGNYQSLINATLRAYLGTKQESLEATLRRVLREELSRANGQ